MTDSFDPTFEDPVGGRRKRTSSDSEPRRSGRIRVKRERIPAEGSMQHMDDNNEAQETTYDTAGTNSSAATARDTVVESKRKEEKYVSPFRPGGREREETSAEQIERLSNEVRRLNDEMHNYTQLHHCCGSSTWAWISTSPGSWAKVLASQWFQINQWISVNALRSSNDLDDLSSQQKSEIVASLEGYCVQEDLDSIISRGHHPARNSVPRILVSAMIHKHLVEKIMSRPFWNFTTNPETSALNDETATLNDETAALFREQLDILHQRYLQVNPLVANMWRLLTVRLTHSKKPYAALDHSFHDALSAYTRNLARRLASEVLEDPNLQCLLKPLEGDREKKIRHNILCDLYVEIASAQYVFHAHQEYLKFVNLHDISPYDHLADNVGVESGHMIRGQEKKLDGHRILILSRPILYQAGGWEKENPRQVCVRGLALIEQGGVSLHTPDFG